MFNFFRKRKLKRLAIEHARKYKLEREFLLAYNYFGDVYEALEEWDLLNDEFMMKVQAEYNQLIDIELPPPPKDGCLTICIESIGVTINIRERAAAPAPSLVRRKTTFCTFIIDASKASDILSRLHALIDGKPPKTCALTILAAVQAGIITKPTHTALRAEFPEIGVRSNYAYYISRPNNYAEDVAAIIKML